MNGSSSKGAGLPLAVFFLLTVHAFAFLRTPETVAAGAYLGFIGIGLFLNACALVPVFLFYFVLSVFFKFAPAAVMGLPVLPLLIPFLLSSLGAVGFSQTRSSFSWIRLGKMNGVTVFWMGVTSLFSALALILWATWTNRLGAGEQMVKGLTVFPKWFVFSVLMTLFAVANAFAEEIIYRGLMQEALNKVCSRASLVIVLQASAFAALHYAAGFPNGVVGYFMVLVYGIMLGYLRWRSGGLLAPYLTHIMADLVIGNYLAVKAFNPVAS